MAGDALTIDFLGDQRTVQEDTTVTFGRAGDIVIDTNPTLHRIVGQFFYADDSWWLTNLGKTTALTVSDESSASSLTIAPGATAQLSFPKAMVSFSAGGAAYSLDIMLGADAPAPPAVDPIASDPTAQPSSLPLTPEQVILVTALAERWLRTGTPGDLPTNREIASGLGWSITKYNRKLDAVCKKLTDGGVTGLVGSQDRLARDRRRRLVEYATYAKLISEDDLALLDAYRRQPAAADQATEGV